MTTQLCFRDYTVVFFSRLAIRRLQTLIDRLDEAKNLLAALLLLGRGSEDGRQLLPRLHQFLLIDLYVLRQPALANLVYLREDDGEGNTVLAQPLHELEVDLLRGVPAVEQDEQAGQLLAVEGVALDNPPQPRNQNR